MKSQSALSGIRVLDFTRVLAGPLCTMMLGDLGADVLKIEHPEAGDETRAWGPPWQGEDSAYFLSVNRNKRSITLNLKSTEAQKIAYDLAMQSQIVVENFKPGQMAQYGLDYQALSQGNPSLVYCSITGFGQTGPYRNRLGYDYVIQAMSGLMDITGEIDGEPTKVGVAVSDVFTGLFSSNAILAALRHAEQSGQGQYIDMALFESQLAALVNIGSNYLVSKQRPQRFGNQHASIVPYQTFNASDGKFVVAVGNDRQFHQLCNLLGYPGLATDPRFATNPQRVIHRDELVQILQDIFVKDSSAIWVEKLLAVGIPAGPINSVEQALTDIHTQSRGMVGTFAERTGSPFSFVASPMHLSETPPQVVLTPPALGEHTREVLKELLGLKPDQIDQLKKNGAI